MAPALACNVRCKVSSLMTDDRNGGVKRSMSAKKLSSSMSAARQLRPPSLVVELLLAESRCELTEMCSAASEFAIDCNSTAEIIACDRKENSVAIDA